VKVTLKGNRHYPWVVVMKRESGLFGFFAYFRELITPQSSKAAKEARSFLGFVFSLRYFVIR
jgi:hypothetical protein